LLLPPEAVARRHTVQDRCIVGAQELMAVEEDRARVRGGKREKQ
jgi:hypothetical protein